MTIFDAALSPANASPIDPVGHVATFVARLERGVAEAFRARGHDERLFAEVAAQVLLELRPERTLSGHAILEWAIRTRQLPPAADPAGRFGEPPVTLHFGDRFHVDVYFWFSSTTAIHEHGFSGAFCVLEGGSVHTTYTFVPRSRTQGALWVGDLRYSNAEVLRPGDVRAILPGREFIHSLFHLESPSVTLVVRTHEDPTAQPQYTYGRPGLALDEQSVRGPLHRRLEALRALGRMDSTRYLQSSITMLSEGDALTAFCVLRQARGVLRRSAELMAELEGMAARCFAELFPTFRAALDELGRTRLVQTRREHVDCPELRFFLALLLNVPDRARIVELVRARCGVASPSDRIIEYLLRLAGQQQTTLTLTPNHRPILEHLLDGALDAEVVRRAALQYHATEEHAAERIAAFCARLRADPMLGVLFALQPSPGEAR